MEQREAILRLWFEMWLKKADLGISDIFAPDAVFSNETTPSPLSTVHVISAPEGE